MTCASLFILVVIEPLLSSVSGFQLFGDGDIVPRVIHLPHAARTGQAQDFVRAQVLAWGNNHAIVLA